MGIYTVLDAPVVDGYVQGHLDRIVDELVRLMGDDLGAVILTGGFGRGEGSVSMDDGRPHVVNDYDIEVSYHEKFGPFVSKLRAHSRYAAEIRDIADRLASEFGIKQIDLVLKGSGSYAGGGSPTLAAYDMKHGSKLLYGAQNPIDMAPEYQPADIPAFEGTWLLRNRAVGLLLANLYIHDGSVDERKKEYFGIELNKAVLAMGDALLIQYGKYHVSYAERARVLPRVLPVTKPVIGRIGNMYRQAVDYKLRPKGTAFSGDDPVVLWNEIGELYCELFLFYESERLGKPFVNIMDYIEWAGMQPSRGLKHIPRLVYYRLGKSIPAEARSLATLKIDRVRGVAFAIGLLAARIDEQETAGYLSILKKLAPSADGGSDVQDDWLRLVRAYLLMAHPKGELGRALQ